MKHNKPTYFLLMAFIAISINLNAQQTINSASNSVMIQGNLFEYTIGEMSLITTEHTTNFIISQGYLQPVLQVNRNSASPSNLISGLADKIKVYPNPTHNMLYVEFNSDSENDLQLNLMDVKGSRLSINPLVLSTGAKTVLDLSSFSAGTYFLIISKKAPSHSLIDDTEMLTYKIEKLN